MVSLSLAQPRVGVGQKNWPTGPRGEPNGECRAAQWEQRMFPMDAFLLLLVLALVAYLLYALIRAERF
ncbi:K(+)-transporting ATPase subunit F [Deinococcus sp. QL22]|uniref:K(+)-transporting ATPase subunit F n=1 Tax=Deinococcus sp. QL22 TaxID=2939437 RepID=UPI002017C076|nr:K(+)-transporting ATPase subunit F [Deinococcus sp. QL22]UQN09578.1 K(+)-transporting ATPase subunit F [Deinococcus sp. QL22]